MKMRLPGSRDKKATSTDGVEQTNSPKPAVRRRKRSGWLRVLLVLVLLGGAVGGFFLWRSQNSTVAAAPTISVPVTQGNLDITIESSGKVEATRQSSVNYEVAGKVVEVMVQAGDMVTAGQALVRLSDDKQKLAVQQAEAKLRTAQAELNDLKEGTGEADIAGARAAVQSAQANLEKVKAGATPKAIGDAEADLRTAQANLAQVKKGATAKEIGDAQADLKTAQTKLDQVMKGATQADLADAEADLRTAQAELEQVKKGATPKEITDAQADLKAAQAKYDKLNAPPSAADKTAAESELKTAKLKLADLKAGPSKTDLSKAQLAITQAQTELSKTQSDAGLKKEQAQIALDKSFRELQQAQQDYGAIAEEVLNEKGEVSVPSSNPKYNQYWDAYNTLKDAEGSYRAAKVTLDNAVNAEQQDVAASQAKLDDANKQLQDLLAGPTQAEFAAAQLEVDNAQKALDGLMAGTSPDTLAAAEADVVKASTKLDELKAGPIASDVASAQSQVDKAQAKLDGLKVGPTSDEVASAEADVVKAQTTLNELQAGPTADKVAAAQSQVDKAANALNDLKAGPTRADVAEAESQVAQKQADLQKLQEPASTSDVASAEEAAITAQKDVDDAKADLDSTVLRAPFSGTVGTVSAEVNSQVTVGSEALSMYDPNGMHVDLEVSESDIEKVKVGQQANLTFDAIPNQVVTGTVTSVSTVATSGQDVVTYKVGVQFKPGTLPARVGMNSTATLIVESKQGVIQVPTRAITTQGPLKTVKVLYGQEETPVTVSVTTGATNGQMTEIVSCTETGNQCLRQGDKVAVTISTGTSNQQPGGNQFIGPGGDFGISVSPGGPGNGPRRIEIAP